MAETFRILIADGSESVTGMLSWLFVSEGFEAETAADGMAAMRAVFSRNPDLVLMAARLPRLDGIQACRLLKSDPGTRDIPVILIASGDGGPEPLFAVRAGADRCLSPDASPGEALAAVRECLSGKSPRPDENVSAGNATPDDLGLLARVNGVLDAALSEATLSNEIDRVGRDVDDFESAARALFRVLRTIAPASAMGVVFSDGVHTEGVTVFPDGSGDPFRERVRKETVRLRTAAGVAFSPDRESWVEIPGGFRRQGADPPDALSTAAVCTVRSGELVKGILAVFSGPGESPAAGTAFTEILLRHSFMALESAWLYRQIARVSVTDGLTGLTNVRQFREQMQREHSRARRHGDPYAVLMMDIDHFKRINDVYGHPAGDTVLRELAGIFRETVRSTDLPARYGGEEFIVFLPQTRLPEAALVGERLREAVERFVFAAPSSMIRCTVSVGIADYLPGGEGTERDVIVRADQALYAAKRGGRNQVKCDPARETRV
ncbi:MAG: hypothetical protein OHK0028_09410 [Deltaproteobacteria bacterium]